MAEDLNRKDSTPSFAAPAQGPDESLMRRPPPQWESAPHAGRFLIAYAALGLVLSITVIALAVALTRNDGPALVWSSWKPAGSGTSEVNDIVNHVAARYRLESGRQIVAIIPLSPDQTNPPLSTVAIDKRPLFGKEQQYETHPLNDGMMFNLCGGPNRCAINEGTPSAARKLLLQREALELALYTFHYVHGVDSVVAFLPPNPKGKANSDLNALYFRKSDYSQQYKDTPLANTLPGRPPNGGLTLNQATLVNQLTSPALYKYQLERSADGASGILLLSKS